MKRIIILMAVSVFVTWGCKKDSMEIPGFPVDDSSGNTQSNGTSANTSVNAPVWVPDLSILGKDTFLFAFTDIDNNVYHGIRIGEKIWSRENLKTTRYNDGIPIQNIKGISQWSAMKSGAWCHYNNDSTLSEIYGNLYNYYAITSNKLAPEGWHVATLDDWNSLMTEIGNKLFPTIGDVGALVDQRTWPESFYRYDGIPVICTNRTLFTALPNGYRDDSLSSDYPEFDCMGYQASWWASKSTGVGEVIYLDGCFGIFNRDDRPKYVGCGIRLVKDAE